MDRLTSRERMIRALNCQEVDRSPCCFMSFTALRRRCNEDMYDLCKAERAMGLDSMLFVPIAPRPFRAEHPDLRGLPVRFQPAVTVREWKERGVDGTGILHKEYVTPAGTLTTSVRQSADWPHGDHIPFVDDYQIPRSLKPLITGPDDLDALQYLLVPPSDQDLKAFQREAHDAHSFIGDQGVLLAGGWGIGMDMADWLCGVHHLMLLTMENPSFVRDLLQMIHVWNKRRMEAVLAESVDLYIRRAWYEGCDFVTPRFYKQTVLPLLKAEADLAHQYGARFGYICSSGTKPMLDLYLEAGIDALIGVDPIQGTYTDMPLTKAKLGERVCLWGGVSGAVTVEMGTEEEVRAAVRGAMQTIGPTGFVLSPVDNITVDAPQTWRNVDVLIDEWQRNLSTSRHAQRSLAC